MCCISYRKTNSSSVEGDYLAFLAQRVPKDIADQLYDDGQPDIGMPSQTVDIADLMNPLSSKAFPAAKLADMTGLLGYIVIMYEIDVDTNQSEDDPYKRIYAASLYLYCFIRGGGVPAASGYLSALRVMATVSLKLDLESRLQVCRFLASLVPMLRSGPTDEDAPLSILFVALSLIVGSIVSDLSIVAEQTMKSERIEEAWSKTQAWSKLEALSKSEAWSKAQAMIKAQVVIDSPEMSEAWNAVYDRIAAIQQLPVETYGASGTVRQAAERFLLAVTEGANHTTGNP